MGSVTCGDGRSVLPTPVGSGSPVEAWGDVAGVGDCWGRSEGVAGAPTKVQGELIALSPSLLPICRKWVQLAFFLSFAGVALSGLRWFSLGFVEVPGMWRRGLRRRGVAMLAKEENGCYCAVE